VNPQYATAHYLLGTLYFSKGLTDSALSEWSYARSLNPRIPVLDASMGLALLHEKNDANSALSIFRDGLDSDPGNVTIYLGADQALSLLRQPASERVQILEKYPDSANGPSSLIFELILNLAETGDFSRAEGLFHNRFFAREEGGTNVRQVWVEVQLQKAIALAQKGQCKDALAVTHHIGSADPDLAFTRDGLEPFVSSARTTYLVGMVHTECGKPEEAKAKFEFASKTSAPDQAVWAWRAAQKLTGFDEKEWRGRLRSAAAEADSRTLTSGFAGWWYYTSAVLYSAVGDQQEADRRFRSALLLPDRMLAYHLTRLEQAEAAQKIH
jgi:tetratricopeptide (TPR) repeat protein